MSDELEVTLSDEDLVVTPVVDEPTVVEIAAGIDGSDGAQGPQGIQGPQGDPGTGDVLAPGTATEDNFASFGAAPTQLKDSGQSAASFATAAQGATADAALPKAGGQMSGDITMAGAQTVDGRDLSVDGAKLDGIEALADVTDAVNVALAINGSFFKDPPVDDDRFALTDSAASFVLRRVTWANIKTALGAAFAALAGSITQAFAVLQLEVGHATDTTLGRVAAGRVSVEGVELQKQPTSNGIVVRTAAGTAAARSVAVTASTGLSVADGNGVAGNPTLAGIDATTSAKGVAEFATAAEYRVGADTGRSLVVAEIWAAAALAALTDGATIAVDLSAGFNFGGASDAVLALGGNRTLGAPSNLKTGQTGILWFGATGATRTLTLNAAWLLMDGVEAGPYSITTAQILGLAYFVRASVVYVTGILRRAA